MRRWAAVVGLVLAGCSETLPLHGDVTFTAEERDAIEQGNAWIATKTGRDSFGILWDLPHPEAGSGGPLTIAHGVSGGPYAEPGRGGPGAIYAPQGRAFLADERIELKVADSQTLAAVAAHEFGHLHGLTHHHGVGVMSDDEGAALVWTDADQAQCVADGVCH